MFLSRKLFIVTAGMCLLAPLGAWAVDSLGHAGCCSHCGCNCACEKVCRMICEMKDVKKTCYTCKCEDFCVPGPSQRCQSACGNCGHCKDCREASFIPTAAYIKTKKVPVKHETVVKKPTYRFVVEYVCPKCAACAPK